MGKLQFAAPCLMGLEGLCADELKRLDIQNVRAENGRVLFEGDFSALARANLCSRYAERIQILLGEFPAYSFEDLFQGVNRLPWEELIGKTDSFPVKGHCVSSKLSSVPDCQKIIKKAVAKRLGTKYGTSWLEETGSLHQIQFLIIKDRCSILLDTSGQGLHKSQFRSRPYQRDPRRSYGRAFQSAPLQHRHRPLLRFGYYPYRIGSQGNEYRSRSAQELLSGKMERCTLISMGCRKRTGNGQH